MIGWTLLLSLLVPSDVEPSHLQAVFSEDFRGGEFDVGKLQLRGVMGKRENPVVKLTRGGLRIVLPARHGERLFAGISTKFHVRGDFEITTAFQILALDQPGSGTGAGALLHVDLLDSPTKQAFSLGRFARPKQGNVFFVLRARTEEDGKRRWATRTRPTEARTGKLRLVREGATIRYLVAEGESDRFQQVDEAKIGSEDLEAVRLTAETSGAPGRVEIAFRDLQIRCDELVGPMFAKPKQPSSLINFIIALVSVSAIVVGFVYFVRSRKRRDRSSGVADPKGMKRAAGRP
jgi:hypothetical protein